MYPARRRHIRYNRATADRWQDFQSHRERVMELLCRDARTDATLCVLGAGNCNDLDLNRLAVSYGQVHLFDLDGEAMETALRRQGAESSRVILHGDHDLGGFIETLDAGGDAESVAAAVGTVHVPEESFDVVASVCLLSQLLHSLFAPFGHDASLFNTLSDVVRQRHYRLVQDLVRPGGRGILVTDFTSSDQYLALSTCSDEAFAETAGTALAEGRCFNRNAPVLLQRELEALPGVVDLEAVPWWRWMIWPTHFAVCGFTWRRADT